MRIPSFVTFPALALLLTVAPPYARAADEWATAKKAFLKAQKSTEWKTRAAGYAELSYSDSPEAVAETLSALAREENPAVLLTGIKTLAGFSSKPSMEALVRAVRLGKDPARLYVILALADQPGTAGTDALVEVLQGPNDAAAAQAALALGRKKVLDAKPLLTALLKHKDWHLRAAGARALRMLAGTPPVGQPGKPPPPRTPAALMSPDLWSALADALDVAEGRERADIVGALTRFSGEDFGWDVGAWRALAAGTKAADVARNPRHPPYFFGVPVHGRRLVILVDANSIGENPHPFTDTDKLKEKMKVPGARPIPWAGVTTIRQFMTAHVKRFLNDLPQGTYFDLVVVGPKARPVFGRLTPVNEGTKSQAITALEEIRSESGNDVFTALDGALDIAGKKDSAAWDSGPEEVLYVDVALPWLAEVTDPVLIAPAIALKARLRMVPITTIGIADHPYELCRILAEDTGGTYAQFMAEVPAAHPAPANPPPANPPPGK